MSPSTGAVAAVELQDVHFAWSGSETAVLDIEALRVEAGERVFLSGPSGCGKSTLLSLLGGVLRPQRGSVCVLGHDLAGMAQRNVDRHRADHIGYVFQMFNLLPYLSTLDNVLLPCRFSKRRARNAQARSGNLAAEAQRLLAALELDDAVLRKRRATELSIGQQQRVAAARALIGAPELLIADEPTSALDEGTRERFLELLARECEANGTSLLLVSHDRRLGTLFDRALALPELNRAGIV